MYTTTPMFRCNQKHWTEKDRFERYVTFFVAKGNSAILLVRIEDRRDRISANLVLPLSFLSIAKMTTCTCNSLKSTTFTPVSFHASSQSFILPSGRIQRYY